MEPNKGKGKSTSNTSEATSIEPSSSISSSDLGSSIMDTRIPRVPNPSLNTNTSASTNSSAAGGSSRNTNSLSGTGALTNINALQENSPVSNFNALAGIPLPTNTSNFAGSSPSSNITSPRNANPTRNISPTGNISRTRNVGPTTSSNLTGHTGPSNEMTSSYHYQLDSSSINSRTDNYRRSPTPSVFTLEREVTRYVNKRESTAYQYYPGTERLDYDYIAERTDLHSTNIYESTAHLIKGSLGAGVLSMHEAYMNGGLWTSLAVTILIGTLLCYAMLMLVKSAQQMYVRLRITKLSYPDLAEAAAATSSLTSMRRCSKAFRYTIDICLFIVMSGTCCIYQIMIAHTLRQAVEGISTQPNGVINIRLYILMSTPGLLILCLIRSLKFLAPFAILADIFVAMCVLTSLYYSLRTIEVSVDDRPAWKNFHGFVRFCGICMYCTSGICVALPVENNMRKPRSFPVAMRNAMIIVIVLTCMTGFFGYWGWGETCTSPITVHMPQTTFTTVLQFLLVMMLCTTFAVQFWVPFRIVWHYIIRKCKRKTAGWERLYRIMMATLVTGVTLAFPDLIPVMIFLGQFFMGFIGIVFPAIIEFLINYEIDNENKVRWRVFKNVSMIILGLFLSASSFYSIKE